MRLREFKSTHRTALNEFAPLALAVPAGIEMGAATWALIVGAFGASALTYAQQNPSDVNRMGRSIESMFTQDQIASPTYSANIAASIQQNPSTFSVPSAMLSGSSIAIPGNYGGGYATPLPDMPSPSYTAPKGYTQSGPDLNVAPLPDIKSNNGRKTGTGTGTGAITYGEPDWDALAGAPPSIGSVDNPAIAGAPPSIGTIAKPGELAGARADANTGAQSIPDTLARSLSKTDSMARVRSQAIPKAIAGNPLPTPPIGPIPGVYKGKTMDPTGDYIYTGSKDGDPRDVLNLKNQSVKK